MFKSKFLLLFLFAGLEVQAQSRRLTLEEGIDLGLAHSRQLQVSGARLDVAHARRLQFRNAQVPAVTYTGMYTRLSDNITPFTITLPNGETQALNPQILNQYSNKVSASQILFAGLRALNYYESAQLLEKAAALDVDRDRLELRHTLATALYNVYKLESADRILRENHLVLEKRKTDVQHFMEQGMALENDLMKADLALSQLELSTAETQNNLSAARYNLNLMLGLNPDTRVELDSASLFSPMTAPGLPDALSALSARPDIQAAGLRHDASEKSVKIAKGGLFPTVSAGVNMYYNNPNQRIFPQEAQFKGTWDAGITLNYNLTNLLTGGKYVEEARANALQSQLQKDQLLENAQMEVSSAYFSWKTATDKIVLNEKATRQARENQRVTNNRYREQIASVSDLLEADFLLLQSRLNEALAGADARIALHRLQRAMGQ